MARLNFSIRHQLLLLAALATASIWAGALLQYLQLRVQIQQLELVSVDLAAADRYAAVASCVAQERGLSNGWLSQPSIDNPAELREARLQLDRSLVPIFQSGTVPPSVGSRAAELAHLRGRIDRRELPAAEAIAFYNALAAAVEDTSSRRLADGMVAVGLPYEYVNHLQSAAEDLAQLRGLIYGALRAGELQPQTETAILRQFVLYEDALRGYERSAPNAVRPELAAALGAPGVRETVEGVRRLLLLHRLEAVPRDATAWWSVATEAVATLEQAARRESAALAQRADARVGAINQRLHITMWALLVLGVVTLALVLGTMGRILSGLNRLLHGLDTVGARGNFTAQIDASDRDEFGTLATGINKLLTIADIAVHEQEQLSLTDLLTGAMNRRGFEQQLNARTTPARGYIAPLCLIMIDIDLFKSINDALGHLTGDQVLRGLVQVVRNGLRPDDVLARFGGEEFIALLPGCPLDEGVLVAEKLRAAIEAHDFGIRRPVTVSLGVAEYNRKKSPQECLAEADSRLYAAKAAGRNRVRPAPSTASQARAAAAST